MHADVPAYGLSSLVIISSAIFMLFALASFVRGSGAIGARSGHSAQPDPARCRTPARNGARWAATFSAARSIGAGF